MKTLALYIHIPFCQHKCHYCDFYSLEDHSNMDTYVDVLKRSLAFHGNKLRKSHEVETLYFGGGTPNLLTVEQLSDIIQTAQKHFTFTQFPEITIEINPEFSSDVNSLKNLYNIGFNRLSIGIQSLNDNELKLLGRLHSAETAVKCLSNAKSIFSNLSVDIIYSIPGQTSETLRKTIKEILKFKPKHISAYNLTCETGTPYARMIERGDINPQDEETDIDNFHRVHEMLVKNGYDHYEISNYAMPEFRSKHNSSYWNEKDYLGIGPSAHSRLGHERFAYRADLQAFLSDPEDFHDKDVVTEADILITRLRCSDGLNKDQVPPGTWQKITAYDQKHPEWFISNENSIKCTLEGWLVLDTILVDLI